MTQHNLSPAPSTSPSTLQSNLPPANVRVPTIKPCSVYVNQVAYVCGEADSKMHLVSKQLHPPGPFPDIDSNFWTRALDLAGLLALHFHRQLARLPVLQGSAGQRRLGSLHGGQRLYDSAMLRWLSNDSRGMINNNGVLTYGGTARGSRRDEIGGDNWNATWYNRVLGAAYRESPPEALVVGE
jgi:hypothetical protein